MRVDTFASANGGTRLRFRAIVVACVIAAGVCGAVLGVMLKNGNQTEFSTSRRLATRSLLNYMGTVKIGIAIPDAFLVNAMGQQVMLSSLVAPRTVILFVDPECGACLEEIKELCPLLSRNRMASKVLVITQSIHSFETWVGCKGIAEENLLKDADSAYHRTMNIAAVPFTLFVDEKLTVQWALSGQVSKGEIEDYLKNGSTGLE